MLYFLYLILSFFTASLLFSFFFNDTATTEIYTLSLHDALPIPAGWHAAAASSYRPAFASCSARRSCPGTRSEEHTSELQSHSDLVCRLLLEKKKKKKTKVQVLKIDEQLKEREYSTLTYERNTDA